MQQLAKLDLDILSAEFQHDFLYVRVWPWVLLDQELSLACCTDLLSDSCFYRLCQLRVISHSITPNAAVTLVHALYWAALTTAHLSTLVYGIELGHWSGSIMWMCVILVGLPKLIAFHTTCGRFCTGFSSLLHLLQYFLLGLMMPFGHGAYLSLRDLHPCSVSLAL